MTSRVSVFKLHAMPVAAQTVDRAHRPPAERGAPLEPARTSPHALSGVLPRSPGIAAPGGSRPCSEDQPCRKRWRTPAQSAPPTTHHLHVDTIAGTLYEMVHADLQAGPAFDDLEVAQRRPWHALVEQALKLRAASEAEAA